MCFFIVAGEKPSVFFVFFLLIALLLAEKNLFRKVNVQFAVVSDNESSRVGNAISHSVE